MKAELVFIEPEKLSAVPFTTSNLIAEFAGVTHHAVQQLLTKHQNDFETFGRVAFEMRPLQTKGGLQNVKIYHLNEEQATLLMTYLKNTPQVREFKKELVKQFYAMRKRLTAQAMQREKRKPVRLSMTDAIRDYIPDSPHKDRMYKNFTDLVYKSALGKTAAQLRKERNAPSQANIAEFLTVEECQAVTQREQLVSALIQTGANYASVKAVLSQSWLIAASQRARAPPPCPASQTIRLSYFIERRTLLWKITRFPLSRKISNRLVTPFVLAVPVRIK